jgi:hypothetical protein
VTAPQTITDPAAASNGYLSAESALENAPSDLEEVDVEGVFGGKVRIRALTAAQAAVVKGVTVDTRGRTPTITWADMERMQFQLAVVRPTFTADQVRTLHATSGRSFARVIAEIDRISAMDKEALRDAQKDFPEPDER